MATYVFSYRNRKGYVPSPETRSQWFDWFGSMGEAVVELGQPVGSRAGIGTCDSATTELSGYSVISAPDLDAALTLARGCPLLDRDGGVEVGELLEVQADLRRAAG